MKLIALVACSLVTVVTCSSKDNERTTTRPNYRVRRNLNEITSVNGICSTMIPPSFLAPDDSTCWQWWTPPSNRVVPSGVVPPRGCDYKPCQDAVCACDDYCCNSAWDLSCRGYSSAQGHGTNYFVNGCSAKMLCCEQESAYPEPPASGKMGLVTYNSGPTMKIAYDESANVALNIEATNAACSPTSPNCCNKMNPPSQIPPDDSTCWQWWTPPTNDAVSTMEVVPKGCDYAPCQKAVCACDDYCCETAWDLSCRGGSTFELNPCNAENLCCEPPSAFPKPGASTDALIDETTTVETTTTTIWVINPAKKDSKNGSKKSGSRKGSKSDKKGNTHAPTMPPVMSPVLPPVTNPPGVSIKMSKMNYNMGEAVVMTFTNPNPMTEDWIGIFNCDTYLNIAYQYTGGKSSGSLTFGPGTVNFPYPAGCHFADYYNGKDIAMADVTFNILSSPTAPVKPPVISPIMPPVTPPSTPKPTPSMVTPKPTPSAVTPKPTPSVVTPKPTPASVTPPKPKPTSPPEVSVSTSKTIYNSGEPIVVTFTNPTPMPLDWIGIYDCDTYFNRGGWEYTGGDSSGSLTFASGVDWPYPAGCYFAEYYNGNDEAMAMAYATFNIIAVPTPPTPPTNAPTLSPGASVTTTKSTYSLGEEIIVNFNNIQPTTLDWIGIYNADYANLSWEYTGGVITGSMVFGTGLANFPFPPASYYAAYFNSVDELMAEYRFDII